jgi:glutaminyl-peptide cyclotransferase
MNTSGKTWQAVINKPYIKRIEHDVLCFTQGLHIVGDYMYESCGAPGGAVSRVRILRKKKAYAGAYELVMEKYFDEFLEGLVVVGNYIYVLTWKAGFLYVLNKENLDVVRQCYYEGEGWGLTHDGENFIMSNGSDRLIYFQIDDGRENIEKKNILKTGVKNLNELEYVGGHIYANVWYKDELLKINESGIVRVMDFSWVRKYETVGVLNGIAYDEELKAFLITGKNWKWIYVVVLMP